MLVIANGGDPVVTTNMSMNFGSANLALFSANGGGNKSSGVIRRLTFEKNGAVFRDFVPWNGSAGDSEIAVKRNGV